MWLLHILLTELNDAEVEMAFAKQGLDVEVPKKSQGWHFCYPNSMSHIASDTSSL